MERPTAGLVQPVCSNGKELTKRGRLTCKLDEVSGHVQSAGRRCQIICRQEHVKVGTKSLLVYPSGRAGQLLCQRVPGQAGRKRTQQNAPARD